MEIKENEMVVLVTDYNIEKNMKDAKVAIGFFIAGFIGVISCMFFISVVFGNTFFAGLITGLATGIGPGAMIVGLLYAYSNIKNLREAKERLRNR